MDNLVYQSCRHLVHVDSKRALLTEILFDFILSSQPEDLNFSYKGGFIIRLHRTEED